MHPKFLGQGSLSLPEKWEAMRVTGPLPFSHVSHCTMGSKSLYFPLKRSSVFSGRLRNAPLNVPITRILVKGVRTCN